MKKKRRPRVGRRACLDEADFAEEAGQDLVHHGTDDDASLVRVRSLCVAAHLRDISWTCTPRMQSRRRSNEGSTGKRTQVRWT